MKIFIYENVKQLTTRYHSGGGLVVIAEDENQVAELLDKVQGKIIGGGAWGSSTEADVNLTAEEQKAVKVFDLAGSPAPDVIFFPNAGCC